MAVVNCGCIDDVIWLNEPDNYQLHNTVHVYDITISASLHLLSLADALLNEAEHRRAQSYYQPKDRERFIVSRVALRQLLAAYLHLPPKEIVFAMGDNKKPLIQNTDRPVRYNVSHSGDRVLIAISDNEVGVDVEHSSADFEYEEVMSACFNAPEVDHILSSKDPRRTFYLLWTRKEALLKATAKGVDDDLVYIPSLPGDHTIDFTNKDWKVSSFEIGDCYIGSVGYCLEVETITFHHFL